MIEFINSLDSTSVFMGYVFCMFTGIVTSIINVFTEKALKIRKERIDK